LSWKKVGLWQKSRVNETKRREETKMEVRDRRRGGKEIVAPMISFPPLRLSLTSIFVSSLLFVSFTLLFCHNQSRVNETKRREETKMEVRDRRRGGKEIIGATKRESMGQRTALYHFRNPHLDRDSRAYGVSEQSLSNNPMGRKGNHRGHEAREYDI
jgi:hypothetical protein